MRGDDITDWDADIRAKAGMFLAFQPSRNFRRVSEKFLASSGICSDGEDVSAIDIYVAMQEWMARLDMDPSFMDRYLNEGFSGGEKEKRNTSTCDPGT